MSIFNHLLQQVRPVASIRLVYTTKVEGGPIDGSRILFLERIIRLIGQAKACHVQLDLFLTGTSPDQLDNARGLPANVKAGRVTHADLEAALGTDIRGRQSTVCYICGPPRMTDEFVDFLAGRKGMSGERVLCEKWW